MTICSVRIQHRPGAELARWRDALHPSTVVCDRHRAQYDERPDLGPYDWQEIDDAGAPPRPSRSSPHCRCTI